MVALAPALGAALAVAQTPEETTAIAAYDRNCRERIKFLSFERARTQDEG